MKKIFKFKVRSMYGEQDYDKDDLCEVLGFTYQDCGPVVWCLHLKNKKIIGCSPVGLEYVDELEALDKEEKCE